MKKFLKICHAVLLLAVLGGGLVHAAPDWIWSTDKNSAKPNEVVHFRKTFNLNQKLAEFPCLKIDLKLINVPINPMNPGSKSLSPKPKP